MSFVAPGAGSQQMLRWWCPWRPSTSRSVSHDVVSTTDYMPDNSNPGHCYRPRGAIGADHELPRNVQGAGLGLEYLDAALFDHDVSFLVCCGNTHGALFILFGFRSCRTVFSSVTGHLLLWSAIFSFSNLLSFDRPIFPSRALRCVQTSQPPS